MRRCAVPAERSALGLWWRGARRDPAALACGIAFLVFGVASLARGMGARLDTGWIIAAVLISLGLAGLASIALDRTR